jgi:hypothetical protein
MTDATHWVSQGDAPEDVCMHTHSTSEVLDDVCVRTCQDCGLKEGRPRCIGTTKKGSPCQAGATAGPWCTNHVPSEIQCWLWTKRPRRQPGRCETCGRYVGADGGCIPNSAYPFGMELGRAWPMRAAGSPAVDYGNCAACHVGRGEYHHRGCTLAKCVRCGEQDFEHVCGAVRLR